MKNHKSLVATMIQRNRFHKTSALARTVPRSLQIHMHRIQTLSAVIAFARLRLRIHLTALFTDEFRVVLNEVFTCHNRCFYKAKMI